MSHEKPTILSLLQKAADHLAGEGIDEARLNAELLLAHALHVRRLDLYLQFDRPLADEEVELFRTFMRRRLAHEPVQYIVGETEFMGCPLAIDRRVLIPRPETEYLVEKAVAHLRHVGNSSPRVLDIGTGSGNIPVALMHFVPACEVTSIDVSEAALGCAAENLERNGAAGVRLLHADIFADPLPGEIFDMIISNPPYISQEEFALLAPEVQDYEPKLATTDGGDGLRAIRKIIAYASGHLAAGGSLFLEIAYEQSDRVVELCRSSGLGIVETFADFAGVPRIVRAEPQQKDTGPLRQ